MTGSHAWHDVNDQGVALNLESASVDMDALVQLLEVGQVKCKMHSWYKVTWDDSMY